jgi:5'-nucleotidase
MRPLILVSNDDGFESPGIHALTTALCAHGDVVVVAPHTEQSASSHALSLHRPLRLRQHSEGRYSVDGTPADCVYVALLHDPPLVSRTPDLVVSGVNRGLNLGQDAFYSGTIAAAREAALRGIPALAVSAELGGAFEVAAGLAARVAMQLLQHAPKTYRLLNLNVPTAWNGKVESARLGRRHYEEAVYVRQDPRDRGYLWLGGPGVSHLADPGADTDAFDRGFATLTSLSLDPTLVEDGGISANLAAALA